MKTILSKEMTRIALPIFIISILLAILFFMQLAFINLSDYSDYFFKQLATDWIGREFRFYKYLPFLLAVIAAGFYLFLIAKKDYTALPPDAEEGFYPLKENEISLIPDKKILLLGILEILLLGYLVIKNLFTNVYFASDMLVWLLTIIIPAIIFGLQSKKIAEYKILKLAPGEIFFLLTVVLFLGSILLPALTLIPFIVHYDEATIGNLARQFFDGKVNIFELNSWYGYPNFGFYPYYLVLKFVSNDLWGLRFTGFLSALIALLPFYYLARTLFNKEIAAISTIIMYSSHIVYFFFRTGMHHSDGLVMYSLIAFFLVVGLKINSRLFVYLSGAFCAFGFFSYMSARIMILIMVIYLAVLLLSVVQKKALLKFILVFMTGFVITFMPLGVSFIKKPEEAALRASQINIFTNEAAFKHASGGFNTDSKLVVFAHYLWISATSFNYRGDLDRQYRIYRPFLEIFSAMFFILGLAHICFRSFGIGKIPLLKFKKEDDTYLLSLKITSKSILLRMKDERLILLFISFWLIVILGWAINVDPPTFQKLPIILPALSLIIAIPIYNIFSFMVSGIQSLRAQYILKTGLILILLVAIIISNFETFLKSKTFGLERADFYMTDTYLGYYAQAQEKLEGKASFILLGFVPSLSYTLDFFKYNKNIHLQNLSLDELEKGLPVKEKVNTDMYFISTWHYDPEWKSINMLNYYYPRGSNVIINNLDKKIMFVIYKVSKEEINRAIEEAKQPS
jgi:hypothetical protein